jgi:hypothetical protein
MKMHRFLSVWLAAVFLSFFSSLCLLQANPPHTQPHSLFEWIEQPETLRVTIETDLRSLLGDEGRFYQPARFIFYDAMGQYQELLAEVKTRGKSRRRICDFPPLKVRVAEEELYKRQLKPHNNLKLVTHCLSNEKNGRDNLLREYLAYEFYNRISPMSFRVKLAEITYVDSKQREAPFSRLGFFLEPVEELAERLEGEEVEEYGMEMEQVEPRNALEMCLFQYFIGNTDWDLPNLRNVKLVRHTATGDLFAIPYDFDFAGWVDAAYAVPNVNVGQYTVKERLYLGELPGPGAWNQCYQRFESHRAALEEQIQQLDDLSPASRRELVRYIDSFFQRDGEQLAKQMQEEVSKA